MTDASEQLHLKLPREPVKLDAGTVERCQSMTKAIVLCAELAGLVNDKDQARAIGIDPTTWSMIRAGQRAFPHEKYSEMFDEFGNELPLLWLLHQRGYDLNSLRKRESETERKLRETQDELAKTKRELAVIEEHIKRTR